MGKRTSACTPLMKTAPFSNVYLSSKAMGVGLEFWVFMFSSIKGDYRAVRSILARFDSLVREFYAGVSTG
jgi:hypothetical protein